MLVSQFVSDPIRIAPEVNYGPYDGAILRHRVEDAIGKDPAEKAMIVPINDAVNPASKSQSFDVCSQASREVVAQPTRLSLVEQKAIIEILKGVLGYLDRDHGLPMVDFTESQSSRRAEPSRTLARR